MKLSVVIPVYNEEKTVQELLRRVLAEKTPKEIIVVDDGSTDGTWKKVQSAKRKAQNKNLKLKIFRNLKNVGKGSAVRKGIAEAVGDVLIIQDADLEYDPDDYGRLMIPILKGETEVVYGSRLRELKFRLFGKNRTPLPLHYIANHFLSLLTSILYGLHLTDMETCYKMMTKTVYKKLDLISDRFEIEPEITAKIAKQGYKIIEVPIFTKPRGYREGKKIKARDMIVAIWTLLKYRLTA